ncbi:MAG: amidophosphoribosyltransferase [Ponticaulis sp.]|nr:amidophosphoribosyltransferase [Ponticaulis sp.]|tara:strand:- start:96215 stop:97003 length:789 start_codon:yes stop_codon:yes gene_type:complete
MPPHMARSDHPAKRLSVLKEPFQSLFGWLWPGQSVITGDPLWGDARLGVDDFNKLNFVSAPFCDQCGIPFDRMEEDGQICGACVAAPPLWHQARAPFVYDDISSNMVLALKRGGRRSGLKLYARYIYEMAREQIDTADVLIPVPIHYRRLASRGYNQAGWLATALGQLTSTPVAHRLIRRKKPTKSQGHLTARQRKQNVAGAFVLTESGYTRLQGQRIVIVDDVLTSGATLNACARTLSQAKPANIDVVTLARVVAPKNALI